MSLLLLIACAADAPLFTDRDGDGFGDPDTPGCTDGYACVSNSDDCNDFGPGTFPGAAPIDSATACMEDEDGDDRGSDAPADGAEAGTDCDDTDPNIAAVEVPYDFLDNDCDPATPDDDLDSDGFGYTDDCDDLDPGLGGPEVPFDGIDNDCDPTTGDAFVALSVGGDAACAVDDGGSAVCWDDRTAVSIDSEDHFTSIATGRLYTCLLTDEHQLDCYYTAFDFDHAFSEPDVIAFDTGKVEACYLDTAGSLACRSSDITGTYADVSVGSEDDICALDASGVITCWDSDLSPPVSAGFVRLSVGRDHACALNGSGAITCWGGDSYGQATPPEGTGFIDVVSSDLNSCAVDSSGAITCWGASDWVRDEQPTGGDFIAVGTDYSYSCGLDSTGAVACWGDHDIQAITPIAPQ